MGQLDWASRAMSCRLNYRQRQEAAIPHPERDTYPVAQQGSVIDFIKSLLDIALQWPQSREPSHGVNLYCFCKYAHEGEK